MNDLARINQANARAIADNIPQLIARGCFVVVEYTGLHVTGCESFSGDGAEQRARAKLEELNAGGNSSHGELHTPPTDYVGEVRPADVDIDPIFLRDVDPISLNGGGSSCVEHGGGSGGVDAGHLAQRFESVV